jgi:hypothetical protein
MGSFMLMTLAAPSARAVNILTKFDFDASTFAPTDTVGYPQNSGQQSPPAHLFNEPSAGNGFPSGQIEILPTGGNPGGVLDLSGEANITSGKNYCFVIGGISTTGQTDIMLSFDIASIGNGGQFDTLTVEWGTNTSQTVQPTSFPNSITLSPAPTLGTNTNTVTWQSTSGTLTGADNLPAGTYLWIEFCFKATHGNNATGNHTFLDNIVVTGVPEPSTILGGLLGALGLCWSQRRVLVRSLRLRRT